RLLVMDPKLEIRNLYGEGGQVCLQVAWSLDTASWSLVERGNLESEILRSCQRSDTGTGAKDLIDDNQRLLHTSTRSPDAICDTGHFVKSGTHLLLELKDSWMWTHSPGNSHLKVYNPLSCHSPSLSWTCNTNLPRKRNHLPPGYPVPPPPSLPSSQEPDESTSIISFCK
ncbi:hypothetical protein AMECASPLE_023557, partial [Ameca splendens]